MKIKDLIPNSVFACIGYCDAKHLITLEQYIQKNKFLLDLFDKIYVVYTSENENNEVSRAGDIWEKYFKIGDKLTYAWLTENRGHTFGTLDLDDDCIKVSKTFKKKYIFKSTVDVVFFPQFLDKEIPEADFYYLNGIGFAGLERYDFDLNRVIAEDFFPQSNFYIIKNNIDYLNSKQEIDEGYALQLANPGKRAWELKQGLESETFLRRCVERNNLTKYHLMDVYNYKNLMQVIKTFNIHDSSHKNILLNDPGLCHLHNPSEPTWGV